MQTERIESQVTRRELLDMAARDPCFRDFLMQLRNARGYADPRFGLEYFRSARDEYGVYTELASCNSVMMVVTLREDWSLSQPQDPTRLIQDGRTRLPIWLFHSDSVSPSSQYDQEYWSYTERSPLYVGANNSIYSSTEAIYTPLRGNHQHQELMHTTYINDSGVYIMETNEEETCYEAHIFLFFSDLETLVNSI